MGNSSWLTSISLSKEGVKYTKIVNNQTTITYISRGKALAYFIPIWLGFFGLIWLIAKATTGGFSKK
ncbi:hypothetical protein [endosymbiont GvMRE of Glomus versiforme]|uniref:hypothetical protein n=1 Tax=endosymbiont GvMRE of Glomus versiforme TaxID=2039283 RepID=UPI0011C47AF3|nr:hypothetical protein [endosymbiont GvMRE of Glomus versiforme]